jgi:glycosyltransferase involved in cell wall biosynthesis
MITPAPILFTIPNFITAGSGGAMLNIIERLDRHRFAPAVCVSQKGGDLDRVVEEMGIPFIEASFTVPAKPYTGLYQRVRVAARVFHPFHFQIWHSFHYADDYSEAIIARLAGSKAWVFTKKNMGWGSRAWYLRAILASRIAAQNTDMLRDFFGKWPLRDKTRFIQRGVETDRFHPDGESRLGLKCKLAIPYDVIIVTTVAHLLPVKGHPTLLRAIAQVPGAHLLVAGKPQDEEYAESLHVLAAQLGILDRIHFLDGVSDVPALLAETDVFVLPTWAKWRMEGCPVALLEAMSSGKACIASDIPGARDLIVHGESGLLVAPEDADALAQAIRQLAENPVLRAQFSKAARRRVEQNFTIEHEVARHEALYAEILGWK